MQTRSMPSSSADPNAPRCSSPPKSSFPGGEARVSATRTRPPSRSTQRATDSPVSPRPRTRTCFFASVKSGSRII
jgi:hypothetical protein